MRASCTADKYAPVPFFAAVRSRPANSSGNASASATRCITRPVSRPDPTTNRTVQTADKETFIDVALTYLIGRVIASRIGSLTYKGGQAAAAEKVYRAAATAAAAAAATGAGFFRQREGEARLSQHIERSDANGIWLDWNCESNSDYYPIRRRQLITEPLNLSRFNWRRGVAWRETSNGNDIRLSLVQLCSLLYDTVTRN